MESSPFGLYWMLGAPPVEWTVAETLAQLLIVTATGVTPLPENATRSPGSAVEKLFERVPLEVVVTVKESPVNGGANVPEGFVVDA